MHLPRTSLSDKSPAIDNCGFPCDGSAMVDLWILFIILMEIGHFQSAYFDFVTLSLPFANAL